MDYDIIIKGGIIVDGTGRLSTRVAGLSPRDS